MYTTVEDSDRGQAVGHGGPQLDELATCGHGGAGQQQKTGPHPDSETAARGPGPWCSLLWLYSFPLGMHTAVKAGGGGGGQAGGMHVHCWRG